MTNNGLHGNHAVFVFMRKKAKLKNRQLLRSSSNFRFRPRFLFNVAVRIKQNSIATVVWENNLTADHFWSITCTEKAALV